MDKNACSKPDELNLNPKTVMTEGINFYKLSPYLCIFTIIHTHTNTKLLFINGTVYQLMHKYNFRENLTTKSFIY